MMIATYLAIQIWSLTINTKSYSTLVRSNMRNRVDGGVSIMKLSKRGCDERSQF